MLASEHPGFDTEQAAFESTEIEIKEMVDAIRKELPGISDEDAYREYDRRKKFQRIIIGTNFLETGITMTVRYYSGAGLQVQRVWLTDACASKTVTVEATQDKIKQRFGRVGRKFSGEMFPLFTRENFLKRPEFSKAEITRSCLDNVLLTIVRCGVDDLPQLKIFGIDYDDPEQVREVHRAQRQLLLAGAVDHHCRPTLRGLLLEEMQTETINMASMMIWAERFGYAAELATIAAAVQILGDRNELFLEAASGVAGRERFRRTCIDDVEFYLKLFLLYMKAKSHGNRALRRFYEDYGLNSEVLASINETRKSIIKGFEKNVHFSQLVRSLDVERIYRIRGALARAMREWIFVRDKHGQYRAAFPETCPLEKQLYIDRNSVIQTVESVEAFVCLSRSVKNGRVFATSIMQIDPEWISYLSDGSEFEFFVFMDQQERHPFLGMDATRKRIQDSPLSIKPASAYTKGETHVFLALHYQQSKTENEPHLYFVQDFSDDAFLVVGLPNTYIAPGQRFRATVKSVNRKDGVLLLDQLPLKKEYDGKKISRCPIHKIARNEAGEIDRIFFVLEPGISATLNERDFGIWRTSFRYLAEGNCRIDIALSTGKAKPVRGMEQLYDDVTINASVDPEPLKQLDAEGHSFFYAFFVESGKYSNGVAFAFFMIAPGTRIRLTSADAPGYDFDSLLPNSCYKLYCSQHKDQRYRLSPIPPIKPEGIWLGALTKQGKVSIHPHTHPFLLRTVSPRWVGSYANPEIYELQGLPEGTLLKVDIDQSGVTLLREVNPTERFVFQPVPVPDVIATNEALKMTRFQSRGLAEVVDRKEPKAIPCKQESISVVVTLLDDQGLTLEEAKKRGIFYLDPTRVVKVTRL